MDEWEDRGVLNFWMRLAVEAMAALYICQSTVV